VETRKEMTLKEIGDLMKARLKELGKTQRQLSEETGIHHITINEILNGRGNSGRDRYEVLARHLGITFEMTIPVVRGRPEPAKKKRLG